MVMVASPSNRVPRTSATERWEGPLLQVYTITKATDSSRASSHSSNSLVATWAPAKVVVWEAMVETKCMAEV